MNTKINQVNAGLMAGYLLVPAVLALVALVSPSGEYSMAFRIVLFVLGLLVGYFVVFTLAAPLVFSAFCMRFKEYCRNNGCQYDSYFYGRNVHVAVDIEHRTMGLLFRFNPTAPIVVSLDEVHDAKTDNGAGALSFEGTRGVYFSFKVDNKVIQVWTFTANSTFSLQSSKVMEAIEKADKMVAAINA